MPRHEGRVHIDYRADPDSLANQFGQVEFNDDASKNPARLMPMHTGRGHVGKTTNSTTIRKSTTDYDRE